MISVPSRLQPLNGSNWIFLVVFFLSLQSCGVLSPAVSDGGKTGDKKEEQDERLPSIEGTRVYDPVKQEWVTIQPGPKEKMDTIQFADAPLSQIPPITMDGVDQYTPNTGSGQQLESYNLTLLLPFLSNRVDVSATEITSSVTKWSLQFYAATKLALNDLSAAGINLDVSVIDTEGDPQKVERMLDSRIELANANVIIGPYRRENIRTVAEYVKQQNKIMISPYSAASNLTVENPNFIQVSPSLETHCENLLQHARDEFEPEEIILVARDIPIEKLCLATMQQEHFNILGTAYADSLEYILASEDATDFLNMDLSAYFEAEEQLAFVVPSWADETFIYSLLRKIDLAKKEFQRVVVYGMPQWITFDHIDFEYYEKLNVRVSSSSFVDTKEEEVKSFRRDYYDQYGELPANEAYMAYDLVRFVGEMLAKYGTDFVNQLDQETKRYMHTQFQFQKVMRKDPNAVELNQVERYENKFVNILEFNNFAFEKSNN